MAVGWEDVDVAVVVFFVVLLVADPVLLPAVVVGLLDSVGGIPRNVYLVVEVEICLVVLPVVAALVAALVPGLVVGLLFLLAIVFAGVGIAAKVDLDSDMVHYFEVALVVDHIVMDNHHTPVAAVAAANPCPYCMVVAVAMDLHYFQTERPHPNELVPIAKSLWNQFFLLQRRLWIQLYPLL